MVTCVPITTEKIRAEVYLGPMLLAKTPFILSFQVNKSRAQVTNTAAITVDILGGITFPLGEKITIRAGTRGNLKPIFTGIIKETKAEPSFGRPSYFRVTFSCEGVLSALENKRFTRRLRSDGQGLFCLITGGSQNRPESYYSFDVQKSSGSSEKISQTIDPSKNVFLGGGEHSPLITNRSSFLQSATGGLPTALATPATGGSLDRSGGLDVHDHSEMTKGGPAWGVYSEG